MRENKNLYFYPLSKKIESISSLLLLLLVSTILHIGTIANGVGAPYVPALRPGDSWSYDVSFTCQEKCPIPEQPRSIDAEVLDVMTGPECVFVDCRLTLDITGTFANGSVVETTLSGNLQTGSGNLSAYVIAPGFDAGDLMPVRIFESYEQAFLSFSKPPRVNSTLPMNVVEFERSVNMLDVSLSSGTGRAVFFWDQPTGVMVRFHGEAPSVFDWTIVMGDTNIWTERWSVGSTWILNRGLNVPGNFATFNMPLKVPTSVAFNSANNRVYLTNGHSLQTGRSSDTVSVIDAGADRIADEISVSDPRGIAYYPPNNYLYVASTPGVTVIDAETDTVVGNITLGSGTTGIAYSPTNNRIYVANSISNTVSVIDAATNVQVANVAVGEGPMGIAVDPVNRYVYVNCFESGVVSVLSEVDNSLVSHLTVNPAPPPPPMARIGQSQVYQNIAYDSSNNNVYLFNGFPDSSSRTLHIVNGVEVIGTMTLTGAPGGIIYESSTDRIYVTNYYSSSSDTNTVSVVDPDTNTIVHEVNVGWGPTGLAYNTANQHVYVANARSDSVSIIDSRTEDPVGLVLTGVYPSGLAYNQEKNIVYVSNSGSVQAAAWKDSVSQTILAIDLTSSVVSPVVTGGLGPAGMVYDPSNGYLYMAHLHSGGVSVIDGSTFSVVANVPIGVFQQIGIAHNPDQHVVYVASQGGGSPQKLVSIIDDRSNTVVGNITVGYFPLGLAYNPSNKNLYVTHYPLTAATGEGSVTVISTLTNSVVANLTLPGESAPIGVAYNPANGNVYVADYLSRAIVVIDENTNTIVDSIPVDVSPQNLIVDPDSNEIFVTGTLPGSYEFPVGNTVTVLSAASNTVIGGLKLGYDPAGGAYDAANRRLFVANHMSGTVSTITLSGLPTSPPGSAGSPESLFGLQPALFYGLVATVTTAAVALGLFVVRRRWTRISLPGPES